MTREQFNAITDWQNKTFGEGTPESTLFHLVDEIAEVHEAIIFDDEDRRLEFADCFFLLFCAAARDGMTYDDICAAIDEKFEINKKREWGKPDNNGVVRHIKNENG